MKRLGKTHCGVENSGEFESSAGGGGPWETTRDCCGLQPSTFFCRAHALPSVSRFEYTSAPRCTASCAPSWHAHNTNAFESVHRREGSEMTLTGLPRRMGSAARLVSPHRPLLSEFPGCPKPASQTFRGRTRSKECSDQVWYEEGGRRRPHSARQRTQNEKQKDAD